MANWKPAYENVKPAAADAEPERSVSQSSAEDEDGKRQASHIGREDSQSECGDLFNDRCNERNVNTHVSQRQGGQN